MKTPPDAPVDLVAMLDYAPLGCLRNLPLPCKNKLVRDAFAYRDANPGADHTEASFRIWEKVQPAAFDDSGTTVGIAFRDERSAPTGPEGIRLILDRIAGIRSLLDVLISERSRLDREIERLTRATKAAAA